MNDQDNLLRIENLSVDFVSEEGSTRAVNNISLAVNRGEIVALVGESGSGKSVTSLSILNLLPQPPAQYVSGKLLFSDNEKGTVDLLRLRPSELQRLRGAKIAMIFQEPMTSLNPVMSCGKQIMEALLVHQNMPKVEAKRRTIHCFEKVRLPEPEKIFDRYPHQLSGGQKQRVMIAMAMICEPSLLICDEPTTALDVTVQKTVLQLIKELQQEKNIGVIFITHDLGVVAEIADRVALLYKGEIVEEGSVNTIFSQPRHPYTKALIACRPALHPKDERLPTVSDFLDTKEQEKQSTLVEDQGRKDNVHKEQSETTNQKSKTINPQPPLIDVQNLTVKFPTKTSLFGKTLQLFTAVNDVSFSIFQNEALGLVGESGCGKTTVGRTLLRLIEPTCGKILYNGRDVTGFSKTDLKNLRKDVQVIFQDPYSSLNPRLTVGDAIAEPMLTTNGERSVKERKKKVAALLEKVSLSPSVMNRYPHQFSGGQRQRIVIARALALNPSFVVCDESVSALDVSVQAQVLNLLNDLKKSLGLTLLFISHDLSVVRYMCDRTMVMRAGQIVESGNAEEVYRHPKADYTKKLIEAIPAIA